MSDFFRSKEGQDKFVSEYLLPKRDGVFFEAGAIVGEYLSNSYFFEKELGWRGVLVEMMPWLFPQIHDARPNSRCFNCAISEDEGYRLFLNAGDRSGLLKWFEPDSIATIEKAYQEERPDFTVTWMLTRSIMSILQESGFPKIDYFSLDVEGAEIPILESIDFNKVSISVFGIEDNSGTWIASERVLAPKGYTYIGNLATDGFFISSAFKQELGEEKIALARKQLAQRAA